MNDLVEGCRITGQVLLDGEDIYGDMNVNLRVSAWGWYFRSRILSQLSIYDNIAFVPRTGTEARIKRSWMRLLRILFVRLRSGMS